MDHLIFITAYHVLVLHITALLRFMLAFSQEDTRLKKEGSKFSFKEYFSDQWDNWAVHYLSMWSLMLILPNLIELGGEQFPILKSVKDSTTLTMLGTFAIGFFGFDAVQWGLDKFKGKDKTPDVKP